MGAGASSPLKPKRRTFLEWWNDLCASASAAWSSVKITTRVVDRPLVSMSELDEKRQNALNTSRPWDTSSESDADDTPPHPLVRQPTYSVVAKATSGSESDVPSDFFSVETHHSPAVVAAAQQSDDTVAPVTLFRAGLTCLGIAGLITIAAVTTQIYPLLIIAGLLAVIGTALALTAYYMNDEEKDGSLVAQAFPHIASRPSHCPTLALAHAW